MKTANSVDAARIELLLSDLRLPAIKLMWAKFAEQSDKEGWPAARFLAALAEHEIADRGRRRIQQYGWRLSDHRPHAADVQTQRARKAIAMATVQYLPDFAYIVAIALFVLSLRWLSSPATASPNPPSA